MEFLGVVYPDSPRTRIKKLLQSGNVMVNGYQVTLNSYILKAGDDVEISRKEGNISKDILPFPVLYEDKLVIVVDKPAGRPTSSIDGSLSVRDIVSEYLKQQSRGKLRANVVHRLDKEVSGVLLFAKTAEAMEKIKDSWELTEKHYIALVEGNPGKNEGTIKSWLQEDNTQKVRSVKESPGAKLAITHFLVLQKLDKTTLLDIRTDTGRKNQIRVQLSELGCPIVGDRKYGASSEFERRIRLHACSLTFPHPSDGRMLTVKSPVPDGFLSLKLRDEKYK
jgi:23S rRNA pseudouridine1911/1915/1917 synthase